MAGPPSDDNIQVDNFDRGRAGMRNILAENERENNLRGSGISVSASSSGPRYSRSQSRRISHPDNSPSRRTQHWSYQISGDSLEQIARDRLAAGNTTGSGTGSSSSTTSNSPLTSISNSTSGGRTVHHSIHVPERSFPGNGQSIANSQFPGQGNAINDDPGSCSLESVPEVPNLEQPTTEDTAAATEKKFEADRKMSYDMQTQATEQRNMSTQTDAPPQSQSNTLSTPRSFSQNALRSGNLDAVRAQRLKALERKNQS